MKLFILIIITIIPSSMTLSQQYLFYLHGKIIEDQGAHAVDTVNGFGAYQYENILDTFRKSGFTVLSEVRAKDTDPFEYCT